MRTITIPNPVKIENGERELTFCALAFLLLASDRAFNSDARGAFAAARIGKRLREADEGHASSVTLETTDAELLKAVFASPADGYPVRPVWLIADFLRAVSEMAEAD